MNNMISPSGISAESATALPTMIVFCHLRWDFVFQRPQQLLTRLAEHYNILFIEEPIFHEGEPFFRTYEAAPNVTVYQPHTPIHAPGFHDDQMPVLRSLMAQLQVDEAPVVWFYTPMALPLLDGLQPRRVVYDCMDELSAFRNAPAQLLEREAALLNVADVVFTGGPSLYRAKCGRHPNVHCFSSSVDVGHFAKALDREHGHPAQAALPTPRLGFYGVIDERFDIDLLAAMAQAHPEWQLIMVGPIVKIDQATLPRNPNIHYMGQASYDELPQYLAGWDVCLLPFALNESTKFISPTKVLEYMAAELPSVSTPITDVVQPYSHIVSIGATPEQFIAACEQALALDGAARSAQVHAMREVVQATSWSKTAQHMHGLIESARRSQPITLGDTVSATLPISAPRAPQPVAPAAVFAEAGKAVPVRSDVLATGK